MKTRKYKKPPTLAMPFDEAIRRVLQVKRPKGGWKALGRVKAKQRKRAGH